MRLAAHAIALLEYIIHLMRVTWDGLFNGSALFRRYVCKAQIIGADQSRYRRHIADEPVTESREVIGPPSTEMQNPCIAETRQGTAAKGTHIVLAMRLTRFIRMIVAF